MALVALAASPAWSASSCYDESAFPAVFRLEPVEGGIRACVGGVVARYSEADGWKVEDPVPSGNHCGPRELVARDFEPKIEVTSKELESLGMKDAPGSPEQNVGAWTGDGDTVWFGISFYNGEGGWGVGGVGLYDRETGATTVRRPTGILDASIDRIVHDGRWLWLATTYEWECTGRPPAHGLVRYEWDTQQLESYEGHDDGPCGFSVHDLLLDASYLWVASDLGVSRWDRGTDKWEHFVPDAGASPPMRPTTCDALYTNLLATLPRKADEDWMTPAYQEFVHPLRRFRPRFYANHVEAMAPDRWGCEELAFLGGRAASFAELRRTVLDRRSIDDSGVYCALEAYSKKSLHEVEWRDFLVSLLERPLKYEMIYLLDDFKGDSKVGDAVAQRLLTSPDPWYEAGLLPKLIGSKSVPTLIVALRRFRDSRRHVLTSVVRGLMLATHMGIGPDGKETTLPGDPGDGFCDVFRCPVAEDDVKQSADHWLAWWEKHKQDFADVSGQPTPGIPASAVPMPQSS